MVNILKTYAPQKSFTAFLIRNILFLVKLKWFFSLHLFVPETDVEAKLLGDKRVKSENLQIRKLYLVDFYFVLGKKWKVYIILILKIQSNIQIWNTTYTRIGCVYISVFLFN